MFLKQNAIEYLSIKFNIYQWQVPTPIKLLEQIYEFIDIFIMCIIYASICLPIIRRYRS